jgi:murein DD-endopeptidase MepM/ murein hydrolase activator NlpD
MGAPSSSVLVQRGESGVVVEIPRPLAPAGGIVRLEVVIPLALGPRAEEFQVQASAFGREVPFFLQQESRMGHRYCGWVGVPFEQSQGEVSIPIRVQHAQGKVFRVRAALTVLAGDYPSETLTVDPRHISPNAQALQRIRREQAELGALYRRSATQRLWRGSFREPIESVLTSRFGIRRLYNGEMRNYHQGADYRAATGTPILAAGEGRIALAKELYLTGNTVIIDHGLGLFTIYAHLNELRVVAGQKIDSGSLLGLSGMTGRASGPHLHFGVNLHRVRVNPEDLFHWVKD